MTASQTNEVASPPLPLEYQRSPDDGKWDREPWSVSHLASARPMPRWIVWGTAVAVALAYALLWSSNFYPLSDSSLYLVVAKGMAEGKGLDFLHQTHRSIRPVTPLALELIIRCGGGIGAMHAVMIALSLASLGLMFLTMRRWLNERVAYAATLLTAMSWWMYANAFTIMTEPPFLVLMWASLWVLSYVRDARGGRRWALVVAGALLLAGGWGNRVAAILLVPGIVLALWMTCRTVASRWERAGWAAIFAVIFAVLLVDYAITAKGLLVPESAETEAAMKKEVGYRWRPMVGITHPLQLSVTAGRWVLETMAAGLVYVFRGRTVGPTGTSLALFVLVLMMWGIARLARAGQWWLLTLLTYFLPLWLMWGTRVKPRYMIPIAPILFVALWAGASAALGLLLRRRSAGGRSGYALAARGAIVVMFVISLSLNGGAYAIEFYLRRVTTEEFYDQARQGGFSELVDICAYLRKNAPADASVWLNKGMNRRIVALMCDRDVYTVLSQIKLDDPQDTEDFAKWIVQVKGQYAIAFYEVRGWPQFHLPLAHRVPEGTPPRWWQLFERDASTGTFKPVAVPRDREVMRHLLDVPPRK